MPDLMTDGPENPWRKPWKGPAKTLGWLLLLAGAVFVIIFLLVFLLGEPARISELLLGSLLLSIALTGGGAA